MSSIKEAVRSMLNYRLAVFLTEVGAGGGIKAISTRLSDGHVDISDVTNESSGVAASALVGLLFYRALAKIGRVKPLPRVDSAAMLVGGAVYCGAQVVRSFLDAN